MDMILWNALELIIFIYFLYVVIYNLTLAIAGRLLYRKIRWPKRFQKKNTMVVLIPAYKEDSIIIQTAREALKQNYPRQKYDVVVIADSLADETITALKKLDVVLLEVKFRNSTKVKALKSAFKRLPRKYDIAVLIDADNIMENDFLKKIDYIYSLGYQAIQGCRKAKNTSTSLAFLDGLSEAINTNIIRRGTVALNMSSSLAGSGMGFKYDYLKREINKMDSVGGFDRELEYKLIEKNIKSFYSDSIVVYDEKVEKTGNFENQRKRWVSSQYYYLKKYMRKGFRNLFAGRITYFNSTVLRNIQLPRLINIGLITFFTFVISVFHSYSNINSYWWIFMWISFIGAIVISIPNEYYNIKLVRALFEIPSIFLRMFLLLFKLKGANKKFIHTSHSS